MNSKPDDFLEELKTAVETDALILPTLPEIALKIRDVVDSEDSTAQQIAETLTQDASLSARLIQFANSPLYRSRQPIDDLQMAVTSLGTRVVRDVVISLAMKQLYQATTDVLDEQFRNIWKTAVDVAAICRIMATVAPGVNSEQALLTGLIHNIGALPILIMTAENESYQDADELRKLIYELQGRVGEIILKNWNFPDHMIEVVRECHNFKYEQADDMAPVYLVQVALLQGGYIPDEYAPEDWSTVPAFLRLGMNTEVDEVYIETHRDDIETAKQSLMM